jgi:hypothetical protein
LDLALGLDSTNQILANPPISFIFQAGLLCGISAITFPGISSPKAADPNRKPKA